MDMIEAAKLVATTAHAAAGQKRKFSGEDYIVHPAEVVRILKEWSDPDEIMISVAWLHDVIEDTGITADQLKKVFGPTVTRMVVELTKAQWNKSAFSREEFLEIELDRLALISEDSKLIKICDIRANSLDLSQSNRSFVIRFKKEKLRTLEVLSSQRNGVWEETYDYLNSITDETLYRWFGEEK